jgi:NADH dehydrogenase
MILVTGGTGFIGGALIRHLVELGYPVRTLIRPSPRSPRLPRGVAVDVAVSSLTDPRGLRAALVGVDTVYHLASGEWSGHGVNLYETDIEPTRAVVEAAEDAGVKRFFFVSHLGADRASAYAVLRTKGIVEETIRRSGLDYTIIRSSLVYGPNDHFTTGLARLISALPLIFLIPGDGRVHIQPLWVEDLVTCLVWALEDPETVRHTVAIGGPEYLSFRQVIDMVMEATQMRRLAVGLPPPYLRGLNVALAGMFPRFPVSSYWLDYMAVNRTTALDTMPRTFNLMPARMSQRLDYLRGKNWRSSLLRTLREREV